MPTDLEQFQERLREVGRTMRIDVVPGGGHTVSLGLRSSSVSPVQAHIDASGKTTSIEFPHQTKPGSTHLAPDPKLVSAVLHNANRTGASFVEGVGFELSGSHKYGQDASRQTAGRATQAIVGRSDAQIVQPPAQAKTPHAATISPAPETAQAPAATGQTQAASGQNQTTPTGSALSAERIAQARAALKPEWAEKTHPSGRTWNQAEFGEMRTAYEKLIGQGIKPDEIRAAYDQHRAASAAKVAGAGHEPHAPRVPKGHLGAATTPGLLTLATTAAVGIGAYSASAKEGHATVTNLGNAAWAAAQTAPVVGPALQGRYAEAGMQIVTGPILAAALATSVHSGGTSLMIGAGIEEGLRSGVRALGGDVDNGTLITMAKAVRDSVNGTPRVQNTIAQDARFRQQQGQILSEAGLTPTRQGNETIKPEDMLRNPQTRETYLTTLRTAAANAPKDEKKAAQVIAAEEFLRIDDLRSDRLAAVAGQVNERMAAQVRVHQLAGNFRQQNPEAPTLPHGAPAAQSTARAAQAPSPAGRSGPA